MPELKQDAICERIEEMIAKGAITGRLPSAGALAVEFGANARTVGKAIAKLARRGAIQRKQGLGAFVRGGSGISLLVKCPVQAFERGSFYWEILQGAEESARSLGCRVEVSDNAERSDFKGFDGTLFLGQGEFESYVDVRRSGRPYLVVEDHPDSLVPSICADIHQTAYRTIRRLLEKGLTRIAYIGMTTSRMLFTDVQKFHAYLEAVDDVLHTVDFSLVRHAWPLPDYFYEQFRDMLRKSGPPQALFITSDFVAPGVFRAAEEAGYRIPEHIQVLSCDKLDMHFSPSLASIDVPKRELGAKAVASLLEIIASPGMKRPPKLRLPTRFVEGETLPSLLAEKA